MGEAKRETVWPSVKGLSQEDFVRADWFMKWTELKDRVVGKRANPDEVRLFNEIPKIGGRPEWISSLTEPEIGRMNRARKLIVKQKRKGEAKTARSKE